MLKVQGLAGLFCSLVVTCSLAFDIEDSLSLNRILEQPKFSPDGSSIAYLVSDWTSDQSIRAHKPLGRLYIRSLTDERTVEIDQSASDPVWSHDGDTISYFQGTGKARVLVVRSFPQRVDQPAFQIPVTGEYSRYSARHFVPIWSADDLYITVAEAVLQDNGLADSAPFSMHSQQQRLSTDKHFRNDTLWRLVRINVQTQQREIISPMLALRILVPSPDGLVFAIGSAEVDAPGIFLGDTYVQQQEYVALTLAGTHINPIVVDDIGVLIGWLDNDHLIAKRLTGDIVSINVKSGEVVVAVPAQALRAADNFSMSEKYLAVWGKPLDGSSYDRFTADSSSAESVDYLIPPPSSDVLSVFDLSNGKMHPVIQAAENKEMIQAVWSDEGDELVVHSRNLLTLKEHLDLWNGQAVTQLIQVKAHIGQIAVSAAGLLAFSREQSDQPPELYTFQQPSQPPKVASEHNKHLANESFIAARLLTGQTPAGEKWKAVFYLPEESGNDQGQSMVVGAYGRQTDRIEQFNPEAQMHASRQYAYLLPDVFPQRGALRLAYAEILPAAAAQTLKEFGLEGKTGYYGGSLGGYAGLAYLAQTDQPGQAPDAAVLRAAPSEFALSWATGKDRDADLLEYLMSGDTPHRNPAAYMEDSPFWWAEKITAPVLFLHGTEDAQVPLAQSEWMFQSLRRMGHQDTAIRVYPGADHSIIRGSRANYIDYYQQIFDWWALYLAPTNATEYTQP